jgi:surfactin synthase thioesterase subunit
MHVLSDAALVEAMNRRYGGIPDAVLAEPDLLELFVPIMRADMSVLETYVHSEEPPLPIPITALGGVEDKELKRADLEAWQRHTRAAFDVQTFAGGHFYLNSHRQTVVRLAVERLTSALTK